MTLYTHLRNVHFKIHSAHLTNIKSLATLVNTKIKGKLVFKVEQTSGRKTHTSYTDVLGKQ